MLFDPSSFPSTSCSSFGSLRAARFTST
jgi:hypothetical protein